MSGLSVTTAYNGLQLAIYGGYGNDDLYFRKSGDSSPYWGSWRTIIHSGNISSQTVANATNCVQKSGDTMSGALGFGNDSAAFRITTGTSGSNSPLRGTKLPATSSNFIGIFARPGKSTDEGGILLSEDTCIVYNSHDTGYGFMVVDTDLSQSDWSVAGAVAFKITDGHTAWSLGGFVKSGSDDNYFLTGGGGHVARSGYATTDTACKIQWSGSVNWDNTSYLAAWTNAGLIQAMPKGQVNVSWSNVTGKPTLYTNNYLPENTPHYFRDPNNGSWRGGMFWGSAGSESMSFVVVNGGTRFQFVCGSDIAGWGSSTWQSASPACTIAASSATFAGSVYSNSDRHLKKNISSIHSSSLEQLFSISDKILKKFTWKQTGKDSYGFIAQELEQHIPEAVTVETNGVKTVSYDVAYAKIIASLVNEIKKLKKAIEDK